MNSSRIFTAAALAGIAFTSVLRADDWPAWGGGDPGRNMYSPAKGIPAKFEPGKFKKNSEEIDMSTTKNVKWIAKLGSQTYGNTVVAYGKVYIGTNNAGMRDPRFKDDKSVLLCLDEKNGDLIWQFTVPKHASGKVNDWEYLGYLSAPFVDGNTLYSVTSRCEVVALNADGQKNGNTGTFKDEGQYMVGPGKPKVEVTAKDADILWRYDMMDELGVFPHNASNSSPLVLDDKVYVCTSNGQDWSHANVPSPNSPSFIVLDKKTGALIGEDDAKIGPHIFHGQWTSPSAGKVDGKWQIYFGGGDGFLYGFDANPVKEGDGNYMKTAWKFDCVPEEYKKDKTGKPYKYPAPEGPSEIIATPVVYKDKIFVAVGQDPEHGEGVGRLVCIDPKGLKGDATKTKGALVWDFKDIKRSISTVAIDPTTDLLFTGDYSGFVYCIDSKTGKLMWRHDTQAHIWGSPMVVDGKVFIGNEDGDLYVFAATKEKKLLSQVNMGAPILSTPVAANGMLFVNTQTHLYCIGEGAKPEAQQK
ncbi:MAG: PQQ-binding-like beta-propeller repeat protein [Chthoniobacteraceae bacterium]